MENPSGVGVTSVEFAHINFPYVFLTLFWEAEGSHEGSNRFSIRGYFSIQSRSFPSSFEVFFVFNVYVDKSSSGTNYRSCVKFPWRQAIKAERFGYFTYSFPYQKALLITSSSEANF